MSLFGDDADAPISTSRAKASLFDDNVASPKSRNRTSIFDDEPQKTDDSPWNSTIRKSGRGDVLGTLLSGADVPRQYSDIFNNLQATGSVDLASCKELLEDSAIGREERDKIIEIVFGHGQRHALGQNEFNVFIALTALAEQHEEISLDAVDESRASLPIPSSSLLKSRSTQDSSVMPATPQRNGLRSSTNKMANQAEGHGKTSFGPGFDDHDPWASPNPHKSHRPDGADVHIKSHRTTSTFSTQMQNPAEVAPIGSSSQAADPRPSSEWPSASAYDGSASQVFESQSFDDEGGFASGPRDEGTSFPTSSRQPRHLSSNGREELVTIRLLDEKEGMFMFQHRNYEVASARRSSKVIRRYSDFVWLLDCLHKRYPCRQLPLLPPKRVAINGNYIAADLTFLEKRRRGLVRFTNALVRHSVLREEQLVVMFLTVPTDLSVWRKQATISVQEEFAGKALPPTLEDSLPINLQETFETVRTGVRRSSDLYINLCNLTERLCKRKEAIAAEYGRLGSNLQALTETNNDNYSMDNNEVPLLNEGISGTAKHVLTSQSLIEDEAKAWDEGFLEDLKSIRDAFVSLRDMFERVDRHARDNIPQLERKIQQNEQKLQGIKAKGEAAKAGEAEKVETAIVNDKKSIVDQHARGILIKECVRDEIIIFHASIARISQMHQDWAQERVKYAELQADNFRSLVDVVESMPTSE